MDRVSFFGGLAIGAAVMLGAAIAVPGIVPRGKERSTVRPVATAAPEGPSREYRIVTCGEPDPAFLPEAEEIESFDETVAEFLGAGSARRRSNETAAIATMRNLISAQAQFQSTARADENNNGVGEFGSLGELSSECPVRGGIKLNPPVLSTAFREIQHGRVERSGYYFCVFLPRAGDKQPLPERPDGGYLPGEVDADAAEKTWCAYAWPKEKGVTGNRTFFTNEQGDIVATADGSYSGERGPQPFAAFDARGRGAFGDAAIDTRGQDGLVWKQAG